MSDRGAYALPRFTWKDRAERAEAENVRLKTVIASWQRHAEAKDAFWKRANEAENRDLRATADHAEDDLREVRAENRELRAFIRQLGEALERETAEVGIPDDDPVAIALAAYRAFLEEEK